MERCMGAGFFQLKWAMIRRDEVLQWLEHIYFPISQMGAIWLTPFVKCFEFYWWQRGCTGHSHNILYWEYITRRRRRRRRKMENITIKFPIGFNRIDLAPILKSWNIELFHISNYLILLELKVQFTRIFFFTLIVFTGIKNPKNWGWTESRLYLTWFSGRNFHLVYIYML